MSKSLRTWTRWISCLPVINTHFLLPRRALAPRRDQQRCVRWQILGVARLGYSPWVFSDCRRYFHTRAGLPHKKEQIEPASSGRSQRFSMSATVSQSPNRPSPTFPRASRDGCGQERNEQTEIPPRSLSRVVNANPVEAIRVHYGCSRDVRRYGMVPHARSRPAGVSEMGPSGHGQGTK